MLITFGIKNKEIANFSTDLTCESCGKGTVETCIEQDYFHIFWIPTIPLKKMVYFYCNNCGFYNERVNQKSDIIRTLKKKARSPYYFFSGIVLAFLILVATTTYTIIEKKQVASYKESLATNKVLVVESDEGALPYTILYVKEMNEGEFLVLLGKYAYSNTSLAKSDARDLLHWVKEGNDIGIATHLIEPNEYVIPEEDLKNLNILSVY